MLGCSRAPYLLAVLAALFATWFIFANAPRWKSGLDGQPLAPQRGRHTATLLQNGHVLVTGGNFHGELSSVERYDPETGRWHPAAPLHDARLDHTATVLPDGRVLVVGGYGTWRSFHWGAWDTAEIYDPATDTWKRAGRMARHRTNHTATLLPNGRVLVIGGDAGAVGRDPTYHNDAELYEPATDQWHFAGRMAHTRDHHAAVLLPDGQVLAIGGGVGCRTIERFDPSTLTFSPDGDLPDCYLYPTATLLPDGRVLITGDLQPAVIYDPATHRSRFIEVQINSCLTRSTLRLPTGVILFYGCGDPLTEYDPETGHVRTVESPLSRRFRPTTTLLPAGRVLVIGGNEEGAPQDLVAIFNP
jgi:hypothetical protein